LLKLKRVNRRFISRINSDFYTEIQFGSGVSTNPDEYIIPNPANVGSSLPEGITKLDSTLDPSNFMYTKTYGEVPYDTTLTINYLYGGGIKSNVQQGDLNKLNNVEFSDVEDGLNAALVSSVKSSVAATNPMAATGGGGGQTANQIRDDALAYFAAQMRAVTKEDYLTRVYAMPGKYGTVSKAYVAKDAELSKNKKQNPFALNLYVLGYDSDNHLYTLSGNTNPVKENLKTYLNQYRMLTDVINIMNAYIINIALKFTILVFSKYNKKEVLLKCIQKIRDYFNIES